MPNGKRNFTYLKDKKIAIYRLERKTVPPGITETVMTAIGGSKLWAHYRQLSGGEVFAARTAGFDENVAFTVNWRTDITPGLHVVYRDKVYEVVRVDDFEGYKKDLRLTCKLLSNAKLSDYLEVK